MNLDDILSCKKSFKLLSNLSIFHNLHVYVKNWGDLGVGDSGFFEPTREIDFDMYFTRGLNDEIVFPSNINSESFISNLVDSQYYRDGLNYIERRMQQERLKIEPFENL